jgi:hypothetical protein
MDAATTSRAFDPESVDLAVVARWLRDVYGSSVEGSVVGRTMLRDEVVRRLGCSQLEGEQLVDTMIARAIVVERETPEGRLLLDICQP